MNSPQTPNPYQTAAVQSQINQQAAIPFNQTGPSGQQTTTQTGTRTVPAVYRTNKKGKQILVTPAQEVPVYTQSTTLSPQEQKLWDQQHQFGAATGELGLQQIGQLKEQLSNPLDLSKEATSAYITELARKRLDPIWNDRQQSLETELRNQGLQPGTKGYNAAMANFDYGRNDAYNSMLLSGRKQGIDEMIAQYTLPVNIATGLMSGSQVIQPQFGQVGATAPVDFAALQANKYATDSANYQARLGGMAGLSGAGLQGLGMAYGGWKV